MKQPSGKENKRRIIKLYGVDENGFAEIGSYSGSFLCKWLVAQNYACPLCFMIGIRFSRTLHVRKIKRYWKKYRKHQWK